MSEFNKKMFSDLLKEAQGDRSLNQFGLNTGVDPGYISRFINLKRVNPPTPEVLKKIADNAYNGVTYEDLMVACGYLKKYKDITEQTLEDDDFNKLLPFILNHLSDSILKHDDKESNDLTHHLKDILKLWYHLNAKEKTDFFNSVIKEAKYNKPTGKVSLTQYFDVDEKGFQMIKEDYSEHIANKTNIKQSDKEEYFPEEFTDSDEARSYVNKHQIFGSSGLDTDKLDDEEILEFANALLEQMKMVSYKYKK